MGGPAMKQNTNENNPENKVKARLFKKILEKDNIENKMFEIESQHEPSDQLIGVNEEYSELCNEKLDLESEIDKLLIETVYYTPLVGLSNIEKQKIDFSRISHSLDYEGIIENEFDMKLLNFRSDMKRRLKKLKGLYLTINPGERVMRLYKEIIRCYVFDLCDACTALCRALVESVAEKYCKQDKEIEKKLAAAKKFEKRKIIAEALTKKLTKELYTIYSNIGKEGSSVLHDRLNKVNEDEALKTIESSQKFINEIYKTPDFSHLIEDV